MCILLRLSPKLTERAPQREKVRRGRGVGIPTMCRGMPVSKYGAQRPRLALLGPNIPLGRVCRTVVEISNLPRPITIRYLEGGEKGGGRGQVESYHVRKRRRLVGRVEEGQKVPLVPRPQYQPAELLARFAYNADCRL
jgi:hypothetical protein